MNNNDDNKKHQAYVLKLETELHEIAQREEAATRRMKLLVYPALFAFIILSGYGFYLVSSLTKDVKRMANLVQTMYETVDHNMRIISKDTIAMSQHMNNLIDNTKGMDSNVSHLVSHTQHMATNVERMSFDTGYMQQDLWSLNKNISKPLRLFNAFIPWHSSSNSIPYPVAQTITPTTMQQQPISTVTVSIKP